MSARSNPGFYDPEGIPRWVEKWLSLNIWPVEVCQYDRARLAHGRPGRARMIIGRHRNLFVHTLESMVGWKKLVKVELPSLSDGRRRWYYELATARQWSDWEI